jgi:hypothetical protein
MRVAPGRSLGAAVLALAASAVLGPATIASGAAGAAGSRTGELRIRERTDLGRGLYVEGSIQFVSVRRASDLRLVATRRFGGDRALRVRLRPGRYRVASWTRVCGGNCGFLEPPTYRCSAAVRIRRGAVTRITVHDRPGARCRISRA